MATDMDRYAMLPDGGRGQQGGKGVKGEKGGTRCVHIPNLDTRIWRISPSAKHSDLRFADTPQRLTGKVVFVCMYVCSMRVCVFVLVINTSFYVRGL